MSTTLYGIANCDTIKKAKKWLAEHNIDFVFHDYRKDGISAAFLTTAESALGWEVMLNKRGTTYRQLDDADKANIDFVNNHKDLEEVINYIRQPVTGTKFFNPTTGI